MAVCSKCKSTYSSLENNFYSCPQNKTGYDTTCKKCRNLKKRHRYYEITEGIVRKRYDIRLYPKYKPKHKILNSHHCSSVLKRLSKYEKKLRWQETQYLIADIKLCEW